MAQQQVEILSLNIDTQALLTKLSETKKSIEQLQAAQKELQKAGEGNSTEFVQQAASLKNLQQSYNKQLNVVQQLEKADKAAATAVEATNTALNKEVKTIDQAVQNNKELRTIRNQVNAATAEGRAAIDAINKKVDQNTDFIKENTSALEKQKMNVGNYTNSIKEALANINPFNGGLSGFNDRAKEAGGAGNLLKQSFTQLSTGIGGATKSALTFIATPIGAVIAGITAAFAAGKAIFDYNKGLQEANKELTALGVNASELSNVRSEITATAETFDKDFKDIASKANSLAKSYGISMSEANNIIAEGLAKGGAQNEEFLDSLGQYDVVFAKAGYSAQQFVDIVNQGYNLGIYADKLPDAIKEADLALKEQGKATRDALINAFGASFTDEILKDVRTGEKTTSEALDAIAKKSGEVSLTQQQQAQLTVDVFKGAGEDAGGAMQILTAINQSANKELSQTAQTQLQLQESTERLNKAQAELFEINGFGDIWTSIKVMAVDALAGMMEYIADVKNDIQPLIDLVAVIFVNAWYELKTAFSVAFELIATNFRILSNTISTFFNFFKKILTGDFSGAIDVLKNGFNNLLNIVGNTFGKIKNTIIDGIQGIVNNIKPVLSALGVDVDKLNKKLENLKSKDIKVSSTTTNTTKTNNVVNDVDPNAAANAAAAEKARKEAAKQAAADAKASADAKAKIIDAEIKKQTEQINLFIAQQGIKKKSLQDELNFQKQLTDKKLALLEYERLKGKKTEAQYQTEKLNLQNEFAKKQADVAIQLAADELALKKKSLEQQKQDDTFFSEDKLLAVLKLNNDFALSERDYQLARKEAGVISEQEYNDAVNQINEENRIKNEEAQKQRDDAKKEQQAIDLENQRIIDEEKFSNDFERQTAEEEQRYQAELKAAEKTGADTTKIDQKHKIAQKKIDDAYLSAKISAYGDMFGNMAQLLGENTAAGKAAAIAQATISTYQGISRVWETPSTLPEPFATASKIASTGVVLASGLSSVKKITGVNIPQRAEGGIIPTQRSGLVTGKGNLSVPLESGDDRLVYIGKNEVVLNQQQQRRAGGSRFFASIGVPGFADGGLVGSYANMGSMGGTKIDYDILASKIGQEVAKGNAALPSPVVQVSEITDAQSNTARIVQGASL